MEGRWGDDRDFYNPREKPELDFFIL
uniref:Uncharacterized protein n=1 Tax=Rhizophora mucronata TaxID=61149 RepID=A0A2P2JAE2_RHIMU